MQFAFVLLFLFVKIQGLKYKKSSYMVHFYNFEQEELKNIKVKLLRQ